MASIPHKPLAPRRALQRWTNRLAIWVVLGGVAGVAHCRRRGPTPPVDGTRDSPARRELAPTVDDLGCSADRELVRHVVGL